MPRLASRDMPRKPSPGPSKRIAARTYLSGACANKTVQETSKKKAEKKREKPIDITASIFGQK
jgi:hypothetical protein